MPVLPTYARASLADACTSFGGKLDSMVRRVHGCGMSKLATERKAEAMTESVQSAVLTALVEYADEAIGNTANREGDAYQQGVRDIAAALAGLPVMPDKLGIGSLAGALEGFDLRLLSEYATAVLGDRDSYNGWTNRETWALNLWLNNDQELYEMTRERVAEGPYASEGFSLKEAREAFFNAPRAIEHYAGELIRQIWDELTDPSEQLMTAENILAMVRDVGSEYRVNWDEIGAAWLEDVAGDESE